MSSAQRLKIRYFEIHNEMLSIPSETRQDQLQREEEILVLRLQQLGFATPYHV